MSETKKPNPCDIITPPVRLSFPQLFVPKAMRNPDGTAGKPKFSASLLLPPDIDLKPFAAAYKAALLKKFNTIEVVVPAKNQPIKPADDKEAYATQFKGWRVINAGSNEQNRPVVVDQKLQPVTDASRIYAGMWVKVYLNAYAWHHPTGGKGVSFGLNAVQIVRDDERLDGRRVATDVFTPLEMPEGAAGEGGEAGGDSLASLFG